MESLLLPGLDYYIAAHTTAEDAHLQALNRETYLKVLMPQMLSGQVQGKFLEFISRMIQPENILEIGTFTGYSAICLAKGLRPGGKLITIDINEERNEMIKKYLALENMTASVELMTGHALKIIPQFKQMFDLVFIDADKTNYAQYFDLVIDKVRPGGWIVADNVLWGGAVIEAEMTKDTTAIDAYNKKVAADPRVEQVIVSVRDGISIARKIG